MSTYGCSSMLSTQARQDKAVRATDIDALSCRYHANLKGYFSPSDPYISLLKGAYEKNLQYCEGYTQLSAGRALKQAFHDSKFPLINRGTYLRTTSIDMLVASFLDSNSKCQIVSLGGGSDTRAYRILGRENVTYTEVDFPESVKLKKIAISSSDDLRTAVNAKDLCGILPSLREDFGNIEPSLHTDRYHLVAMDLREIDSKGEEMFGFLDATLPTMVICECLLCYLSPISTQKLLAFWSTKVTNLSVVVYDPVKLQDAFGETMKQNLAHRGIDIDNFTMWSTLESRKALFETIHLRVQITDLALLGGYTRPELSWIEKAELARVSRIEMIDEIEEITLLLQHYCLIMAYRGQHNIFEDSRFLVT